ncbi:MAG: ATP-binding protein [Candidatus Thorarchaeota archaeon]|nr:MAG: ATP-binding protein [Candidatus Thorarchaeota archaeon]
MYKHYETSDDVFVDREEYIEWMNDALERCKDESVVLHLKGIGGIGKSSLLNHWVNTHEKAIRLDCEHYSEFYQRLNMLAKGAVLHGVKLPRFDVLWQIRQRFVEGVEPVREEGREWAKDVVMAIPFIGSLASIGSAISAVGAKVTPKLKGKYGTIGTWLQETLGKNHIEQLLEILWKDPRRAEFLYLSAFLEDINTRNHPNIALLFLLDHFEYVDNEKTQWRYSGERITETELWALFLSNLSSCVGVMASRRSAAKGKILDVEENELTELDRDSCLEMLTLQGVVDEELQERIVSVSGGNPFLIDAICDMINTSNVSIEDIEGLRADTLAEVRLKVWRRLFSHAEGLHNLINRAGLVPYFDYRIMSIIAPEMTPDSWDRLRRLSFLSRREDGTWVLHDLAEEIVRAELGGNLKDLANEVGQRLERASQDQADYRLLGLALSVLALDDEIGTLMRLEQVLDALGFANEWDDALVVLDSFFIKSDIGLIAREGWRSYLFRLVDRIAEAEDTLKKVIEISERLSDDNAIFLSKALWFQARFYQESAKMYEAEEAFRRTLEMLNTFDPQDDRHIHMKEGYLASTYHYLGQHLSLMYRLEEAERCVRKALVILENEDRRPHYSPEEGTYPMLQFARILLAQVLYISGKTSEAETILRDVLESSDELVIRNMTLGRLGITLRLQHRHIEQLEVRKAVVDAYKKLALEQSGMQAQVTMAESSLALPLFQTGQYQEAEEVFREVIRELRVMLEEEKPYSQPLAKTLQDYSNLLVSSDRLHEAENACLESIRLLRALVENYPERYTHRLAAALNNLGVLHCRMGKVKGVQETLLEAYEMAKDVSLKHPEAASLAEVYGNVANNLGVFYKRNELWTDAERLLEEARGVIDARIGFAPEMFLYSVAAIESNTGILLCENNRIPEAESRFLKALEIHRSYVDDSESFFLPRVASILNNLGIYYRRTGHSKKSEKMCKEALDTLEPFALKEPRFHQTAFVKILSNLLVLYRETKDATAIKSIQTRLRELGVKEFSPDERWFEHMEYLQGY